MSGFGRSVKGSVGPSLRSLGGYGSNLTGFLGGTGNSAGLLGTGQFRTGPATIDVGAFGPSAGEQQTMNMLHGIASGQAPSAAQMQMQKGLEAGMGQARSMAASQRGISPALAARYAAMNQANMAQGVNRDMGILRAQEQANALNSLMGGYQSQRNSLAQRENLKSGNYNFAQGLNQRGYESAAGHRADLMGGLMNAGGSAMSMFGGAAMMSDENQKMNVGDASGDVRNMMNNLSPQSYQYKDTSVPGTAPGQHVGVMAQDLEKSNAGSSMVQDTAHGKMIDPAMGIGVAFAALGDLHKRLSQLEGAKHMADGGMVNPEEFNQTPALPSGPILKYESYNQKSNSGGSSKASAQGVPTATNYSKGKQYAMPLTMNKGGQVGPKSNAGKFLSMKQGGVVPGNAKHKGDNLKNDTVPAMLSPKEIVLPRSVTLHPNAADMAKDFVAAVLARSKGFPAKKAS